MGAERHGRRHVVAPNTRGTHISILGVTGVDAETGNQGTQYNREGTGTQAETEILAPHTLSAQATCFFRSRPSGCRRRKKKRVEFCSPSTEKKKGKNKREKKKRKNNPDSFFKNPYFLIFALLIRTEHIIFFPFFLFL
jgi:hypothetical protein